MNTETNNQTATHVWTEAEARLNARRCFDGGWTWRNMPEEIRYHADLCEAWHDEYDAALKAEAERCVARQRRS